MPAITYADWSGGVDRRLPFGVQDANKLWTLQNAYITTNVGELIDPRLSFDDKRATQYGANGDIILAYLRSVGGSRGLYYRQQRDRFNTEYTLRTGLPNNTRLRAVGMNRGLRMQFELV